MGKFTLYDNGLQMTFENGLTALIEIGSERNRKPILGFDLYSLTAKKVSVAAFDSNDNYVTPHFVPENMKNDFDSMQRNMSTDDVIAFLVKVRDYKNESMD